MAHEEVEGRLLRHALPHDLVVASFSAMHM